MKSTNELMLELLQVVLASQDATEEYDKILAEEGATEGSLHNLGHEVGVALELQDRLRAGHIVFPPSLPYNHAFAVSFSLDSAEPYAENFPVNELLVGLLRRVVALIEEPCLDAFDPLDTVDNQ